MYDVDQIIEKKGETVSQYKFACEDKLAFAEFLFEKDLLSDEQLDAYSKGYSEEYRNFIIDSHEEKAREVSGEFDI